MDGCGEAAGGREGCRVSLIARSSDTAMGEDISFGSIHEAFPVLIYLSKRRAARNSNEGKVKAAEVRRSTRRLSDPRRRL